MANSSACLRAVRRAASREDHNLKQKSFANNPGLLEAALDLARQGRSVIPVGPTKKPLTAWKPFQTERPTAEQITNWFRSLRPWGIAVITGATSGCVVLDVDGDAGFEALFSRGFDLPPTLQVRTPRGSHFYFEHPELPTKNFSGGTKAWNLTKVDFRGDGGYAISPPTPGYDYVEPLPFAPMPDWLRNLTIPGWSLMVEATKIATEGTRNEVGFALARKLRDQGFRLAEAESLMIAYAAAVRQKGGEPYREDEALASLKSAYSRPPRSASQNETAGESSRRSQASRIVELGAGLELFHSPDQVAYVSVPVATHREIWPVRSKGFKQHLARQFFEQTGKVPSATALNDTLTLLEGQALFEGTEQRVHVRVAEHENSVVLDLCDPRWQVVLVDATGWRIHKVSPVKFRRTRGMLPLPVPVSDGDLSDLRNFINVDDDGWHLLIAWILNALRPRGPYPPLSLQGEQGAGKTTLVRMIRALVDPSVAPVRCEPRDLRDLMIGAQNGWLLAFDNLSFVSPWLSDALCRLSTGGGFATRELFTDTNEIVFDAKRPVIVNGIESLITRSDLLDRALLLTLPTIGETQRRAEADLWRALRQPALACSARCSPSCRRR